MITTLDNNLFGEFIKDGELIVPTNSWSRLKSENSESVLINHISDAIELFEVKLPYKKITFDEALDDYKALALQDSSSLIKDGAWDSKFPYKFDFIDKYIDNSNAGLKASNFFHQTERWKCDATGYPSPAKTWATEQFRLTLFKALFSLKVAEINPDILRNLITLRKYIASQFRPAAAKAIYDHYKPETVLDFSMGWGDRLVAAHASNYIKRYVGFDPNVNLYNNYMEQISTYDKINSNGTSFGIYSTCAENDTIPFINKEKFDLIFTSPPYFDKEKYDQGENQSYKKYKQFDIWMKDFLYKTIEIRTPNLKSGGHLIINISDIYTRKKHYPICDLMNEYIQSTGNYTYEGAMGLRMPKRPMSKSANNSGIYGEPIWIWKRK